MARTCSVCSHPDHLDIDAHLLGAGRERLSHRDVASRYGLSRASVQRHAASHIAPIMRAVVDQVGEQVTRLHGENLLTELGSLYERTIRLLDRAEAAGDLRTAVSAIREARGSVETFAKVGLALSTAPTDEADQRTDLDDRIDAALAARIGTGDQRSLVGGDPDDDVAEAEVVG